jgi:hypothetical protein
MRYQPLLIALFVAMLLKPFAESTGAAVLPGDFFLLLVFGTLIYAFRIRSLAFCLTVLGVSMVTLRFLADQRHVPTLAILSQGLSFYRHDCRDGRDVFRGASSVQCFVRSCYGRGLLVLGYRTGLDVSLLFNLLALSGLNFRFTQDLHSDRFRY